MASPTPKTPIIVNADGTVSMLVYQGRTLRFAVTDSAMTDSSGYKARFGLTAAYGETLLASADSEDGTITFVPVMGPGADPGDPDVQVATNIIVEIPDEDMTITAKKGKMDMLLEEPGGDEIPVFVGDWLLYYEVTP